MRALGVHVGPAFDRIELAEIDTDGEIIAGFGATAARPFPEEARALVLEGVAAVRAWKKGAAAGEVLAGAVEVFTEEVGDAVEAFLREAGGASPDLVGVIGPVVLSETATADRPARALELLDPERLARRLGVTVVADFRSADLAAGGSGGPLAPAYQKARAAASGLTPPLAVVAVEQDTCVAFVGADGELQAFDGGPGAGLIDAWTRTRGEGAADPSGRAATAGRINEAAVEALLSHGAWDDSGGRAGDPVRGLDYADGAATLSAFVAASVALGLDTVPERASLVVVSGPGRRNKALLAQIAARAHVPVVAAEDVGWRGDAGEAEAAAFLAVRSRAGLPITYPGTTGAPAPLTGGRITEPGS